MRSYNQQIEDAYAASKRQGDSLRNREIERSSSQDRRNRYRDDRYQFDEQNDTFRDPYPGMNQRTDRYNYERSMLFNNPEIGLEEGLQDRRITRYPETYRSAMGGYMSQHVGADINRRDYVGGYNREGNLYGASHGIHRGKGPKNYRRSDERIREDIIDCLTEDSSIDASEVEIDVQNGEITLRGTVNDHGQKRRAEDMAETISGVSNVENRIRVRSNFT